MSGFTKLTKVLKSPTGLTGAELILEITSKGQQALFLIGLNVIENYLINMVVVLLTLTGPVYVYDSIIRPHLPFDAESVT